MQTKSDKKGKEIFKAFVQGRGKANNIEFTVDDLDKIDAIVDNTTVEIKYRKGYRYDNPRIQNEGILLEKAKVDYALKTISESGYTNSFYCSIFEDNVITFIDFKKVDKELKPTKRLLPKTSEFGCKEKVLKDVYLVPIDFSQSYRYVYPLDE